MPTTSKDPQAVPQGTAEPGVPTPPEAPSKTNGVITVANGLRPRPSEAEIAAMAVSAEDELFVPRPRQYRELYLPDAGKKILLEALTPKDYDEVNFAAQGLAADGTTQIVDSRLWNARLTARAIRRGDKTRFYKDDAEWRTVAQRMATFWTISDLRLAAETVADMSGVSAKARKATDELLGKGSPETATDGGSTS